MFLLSSLAYGQVAAIVSNLGDANSQCTFNTVQEAIDAANPGEVIYVGEDSAEHNIVVDKQLTIQGVDHGCFCAGGGCSAVWKPTIDAGHNGRTMRVDTDGAMFINLRLANGVAQNGGNLYVRPNAFVHLIDLEIQNGFATSKGGNVFLRGSSELLWWAGSEPGLVGGHAAYGGNLYAQDHVSATLVGLDVEGGVAWGSGGNMAGWGAHFTLEDSHLSDGHAGIEGGSIYMAGPDPHLSLLDSSIRDSHAGNDGGAIKVVHNGSVPAVVELSHSILENNHADQDGGGLYAKGEVRIVGDDSHVDHNSAGRNGGGIYLRGELEAFGPTKPGPHTVNLNAADGEGGGMYVVSTIAQPAAVTVDFLRGMEVNSNTALVSGGGLQFESDEGGTHIARNIEASYNTAPLGGGIEFFSGDATLTNSHILGNIASSEGGGLRVSAFASLDVDSALSISPNVDCFAPSLVQHESCNTWSHNHSGGYGGGAMVRGGLVADGVGLVANSSASGGHAIRSFTASSVELDDIVAYYSPSKSGYVIDLHGDYDVWSLSMGENSSPDAFRGAPQPGSTARLRSSIVADGRVSAQQSTMDASCTLFTEWPSGLLTGFQLLHGGLYQPDFVLTPAGDLRLGPNSDAVNICTGGTPTDLVGASRPPMHDMGALER